MSRGSILTTEVGVQKIRRHEPCTRIAGAAPSVRGVLDLRGEIIPIIDLRSHFNLPAALTDQTVIVVLKHGAQTFGAIVDAASDVQKLSDQQIHPLPQPQSGGIRTDCIRGIAQLCQDSERRTLILLHIRPLLRDLSLTAGSATIH